MTIGTKSDFKIYDELVYAGIWEGVDQVAGGFGAGSRGALQIVPRALKGDFEKRSFFQRISNLIGHRDPTTTSAATAKKMTQEEFIGVKVPRTIGPVDMTLDSWRRVGQNQEEMSFQLGRMIAGEKILDYLNTVLISLVAGLKNTGWDPRYDATGESTATLTHSHLVSGQAKLGDMGGAVVAYVMHSKPYYDLVKQSIADKVFEVAGVTIYSGNVASFGRPVIVTDSPALITPASSASGSFDQYNILGLKAGAAVLTESEVETIVAEVVTGLVNLVFRIQGEYAYNLDVLGTKWNTGAGGGSDPDDSALGTAANWVPVVDSVKKGPGFLIYAK